ncbi:hypothetical protein HIM_03842 [Hirsutella minnesotensis 3608]|uniref:Alpha/beta hydrolase fold-3 domain-containing protein n=1 Tax=Hirsutella minnesotensis 3608 TaxID=1043627 RepID=A0A0F7ZQB6_9HYPO|nr:hypothetical protein HIM_03842 [Hirsutella minnesotensis 3608]
MLPWLPLTRIRKRWAWPRSFSTRSPERVEVRCGSAGHVTIDLFNSPEKSHEAALLLHLPAFPTVNNSPSPLPKFLEHLPVASINYRWRHGHQDLDPAIPPTSLCWPTPVHDASFAYAWLVENLLPPGNARRDIYVYGSHLGASLATSLALTESHSHARLAVRGLIAYNGIFNWTMFLRDHPINKPSKKAKDTGLEWQLQEASHLGRLYDSLPSLFDKPVAMFDPFASPSLFFHSPGLLVPSSFYMSMKDAAFVDVLTGDGQDSIAVPLKAPRKSHLMFPPRISTLKIPQALLLHDAALPPQTPLKTKAGKPRKPRRWGHTFAAQAEELAGLMKRSVSVVEMRERVKWDEDLQESEVVEQRVRVADVGPETEHTELNEVGQAIALDWLDERI